MNIERLREAVAYDPDTSIKVNRKDIYLGRFDKFEDAVAARKKAERKHGFHPNHGRAA